MKKKKPVVTYLVSGDSTISPGDRILKRSRRNVRYDTQVNRSAATAMKAGSRYVVIAHGNPDGTVMWFRSDSPPASPWLWSPMANPPKKARIYLYSCHAGKELPRFLKSCECFGHTNVVPTLIGGANDVVLRYLNEVPRLMESSTYNAKDWRAHLGRFVNDALVREVQNSTAILAVYKLLMLRKSLGNFDG